jgi:hypothetical protein
MIIFYDWRKIRLIAKRDPKKVILAMRALLGEVPRNRFDPLYHFYIRDFTGKSFLVNIQEVLENDYFYKPKEIAEYIALASFRNYSTYIASGDTSLDLFHCPVRQDILTNNRLLIIENDRIRFKYEEVIKEK